MHHAPGNLRRFSSAPTASLPATSASMCGRRSIAAHLIAHPLPVVLRHLPPLLTHFLTHLAALVRRNLGVRDSRRSRNG